MSRRWFILGGAVLAVLALACFPWTDRTEICAQCGAYRHTYAVAGMAYGRSTSMDPVAQWAETRWPHTHDWSALGTTSWSFFGLGSSRACDVGSLSHAKAEAMKVLHAYAETPGAEAQRIESWHAAIAKSSRGAEIQDLDREMMSAIDASVRAASR